MKTVDSFLLKNRLLIDGNWCTATGEATFAVENPATGEVIAQVADATPADADKAIAAAAYGSRVALRLPGTTEEAHTRVIDTATFGPLRMVW